MLVDDDPITKTLLQTLLEMEGYQVIPWDIGTNVIDKIHQAQPDLIVMDVNLNEMDGLEVLRELKADTKLAEVRVIMSSGMNYQEECQRGGANEFLLKPYMPDDLITLIRKNLS